MKIVAGMATFGERTKYAERAIESLSTQVDELYLYNNDHNPDITDNGKFYGLRMVTEPCYYFACDDDIVYPSDYVRRMVEIIDRFSGKVVVTNHGRILKGTGLNYYRDHYHYNCFREVSGLKQIDVPGSGVSAWRTDMLDAQSIIDSPDMRMTDLLLGRIAAEQKIPVYLAPHSNGYFEDMKVPAHLTCFGKEHKNPKRQGEIADQIYLLNNEGKRAN